MADNRQVVEQHIKAWSNGDIDGIVACFTEDCVFEDMALQTRFEGHDAVREFAVAVFGAIPDFQWTPTRVFGDGASMCIESHFSGTQTGDFPGIPATNKYASARAASVFELQGNKFKRCSDYWDMAAVLKQIGLMPSE